MSRGIRKPRARWSAFMARYSAHNNGGACPTKNGSSGWMRIVTSTTGCDRMKLWACRLRPAGGARVYAGMIRIRRRGSAGKEPRVVKVGSSGQIWTEQRRWEISYALAGQCMELVRLAD